MNNKIFIKIDPSLLLETAEKAIDDIQENILKNKKGESLIKEFQNRWRVSSQDYYMLLAHLIALGKIIDLAGINHSDYSQMIKFLKNFIRQRVEQEEIGSFDDLSALVLIKHGGEEEVKKDLKRGARVIYEQAQDDGGSVSN